MIRNLDAPAFFRRHFPGYRRQGDQEFVIVCINPECDDESGHCYVNPYLGVYNCFKGCGARGTFGRFLMEFFGVKFWSEVRKELRPFIGKTQSEGPLPEIAPPIVPAAKGPMPWPDGTSQFIVGGNRGNYSYSASLVAEYLIRRRRIPMEAAYEYGLGYGWKGRYRNRLIVPCYENGELVHFVARSIVDNEKPKYLNPRNEETKLSKSRVIFNIDRARQYPAVLVAEGAFDAIALGPNALALLGKSLYQAQEEKLACMGVKEFVVCLDPDAMEEASEIAYRLSPYAEVVSVAQFRETDPGDATPEIIHSAVTDRKSAGTLRSVVSSRLKSMNPN